MESFRDFEYSRWQEAVEAYDNSWPSLTSQTARPMLDALEVSFGTDLLDVASGTGNFTSVAAQQGARVVGMDFSSLMLARAKKLFPDLNFQLGEAEKLPFDDGKFDAVSINFGMLHFQYPERALKQAHRVLRAKGRVAYTVWAPPDLSIGFDIVYGAIRNHGTMEVSLPPGPPFFLFSNLAVSRRALLEAGFENPRFSSLPLTWRLPSIHDLLIAFDRGTARTGATLQAQKPKNLARIQSAVLERAETYVKDGVLELPMVAILCWGYRT